MEYDKLYEVYTTLRGSIEFNGESNADGVSLENLKEETAFLELVITDLANLYYTTKERYEYSGQLLSAQAKKCLRNIRDLIDDALDEPKDK